MIPLILSIISSVAIGNLLHLFRQKDSNVNILQVFLGNYFLASIVSYLMIQDFDLNFYPSDLGLAFVFGILFLINFLLFQENIHCNGMSMSISTMRLSVIIPVLIAIIAFNERLPTVNYIGVFIVLIAFSLMGRADNIKRKILLFSFFCVSGFTEIGMKLFNEFGKVSHNQMLFYLFSSAFLVNLVILLSKKQKLRWKNITAGLILGVPNQLTSLFFLMGLNSIDASIAYPFVSSNVVLLGLLSDKFIWKSKFTRYQYILIAFIVLGVILLNIK